MQCSKCREHAVVFQPYSGQHLCRDHFIIDFETKAKREIRRSRGMQPGDHIAVISSGAAGDTALLHLLRKLTGNRRDIRLSVVIAEDLGVAHSLMGRGFTKLALPDSLEARAAILLSHILGGRADRCWERGSGSPDPDAIREFFPFCHIPAGEILLYARLHGLEGAARSFTPQEGGTLEADTATLLEDYSSRHPAAPHAVLNLCDSLQYGNR